MSEPSFIVGIDLGTTNSVVAYTEAAPQKGVEPVINLFRVPQLVGPGEIEDRDALPSFVILPTAHEVAETALSLPWDESPGLAVGAFARDRGAELPQRLVSSAKSWLCHAGVDRNSPILPWGADRDARKLSPVEGSAAILRHIKSAWDARMAADDESLALARQDVILTVPASFDAVARELTVKAANDAGLSVTLLEEPQAAFYAWLALSGDAWRKNVSVGDLVLVCDVGGGTCDFSLISVEEESGDLVLSRVAVGDHLLVGGDNMDLALAYDLAKTLAKKGKKLDNWQMQALWQSCRAAKEKLLAENAPEAATVNILSRGSGLIAGTIKTDLEKERITGVITDGFFPLCEKEAEPAAPARSGMREMGLSYAADAGITRHMAKFLRKNGAERALPTAVLFNGGVMKAEALRKRVMEVLSSWSDSPGQGLRELSGADYDLAVARGAAHYGLARRGMAVRIKGGLNRAYYIGVEAALPAVPGMSAPRTALCVAPFGMEEGTGSALPGRVFGLVVGERVTFDFLASSTRHDDAYGTTIEDWESELTTVTTLETELSGEAGTVLPVTLEVAVTEVGTLEIWCVAEDGRRFKLEFSVREEGEAAE